MSNRNVSPSEPSTSFYSNDGFNERIFRIPCSSSSRISVSDGYVVRDRALGIKERKRGKATY
ncbi:hypothetical protein CPC08DRAFT_715485 [Agrocybe pediades]|nr:hypothetical protein CPC08DRAFT_715485 [Agrocybe pediades]